MSIYFLRHGHTFASNNNPAIVSVADASRVISLSETGIKQVEKIILPTDIRCIICSDSLRTKQTAEILRKNNSNLPVYVDDRLHPWKSGADNWSDYWISYYFFMTKQHNDYSRYESKESLIARLNSVISDYESESPLIIAHSIILATYLGEKGLPFAKLIKVK